MKGELAGALQERVTIERRGAERDALGGAVGDWSLVGAGWAAIVSDGFGPVSEADARSALPRWRVTMRRADVRVGDRIMWGERALVVARRGDDPRARDRMILTAEEQR